MVRAIPFFATGGDILRVLGRVEEERKIKYVLTGMFCSPTIVWYPSAVQVAGLGMASTGNQAQEASYLIAPLEVEIIVRKVPQRTGGVKYSIDQRTNADTVGIRPCGVFGDHALISGQLGSSTGNPLSDELASLLTRELKGQFSKLKAFWVGKEARSLLDQGFRLTTNVRASREYDLQV